MKIDGSSVAELDFSASIPRLAYHKRKIDVPDTDIYAPNRIAPRAWRMRAEHRKGVRDFIKLATFDLLQRPFTLRKQSAQSGRSCTNGENRKRRHSITYPKPGGVGAEDRNCSQRPLPKTCLRTAGCD
jgi:hypothetical protein